jgi:hypothetical protein
VKEAAETVPFVAGRVTPPPPPVVRVPAGARTAVPERVAETATLPKFISTVLEIVIGVMMFAEAEAVAVACAKEELAVTIAIVAIAIDLMMFFILVRFCLFEFVCLMQRVLPTACQTHNILKINYLIF